jgi:hypothetical protein
MYRPLTVQPKGQKDEDKNSSANPSSFAAARAKFAGAAAGAGNSAGAGAGTGDVPADAAKPAANVDEAQKPRRKLTIHPATAVIKPKAAGAEAAAGAGTKARAGAGVGASASTGTVEDASADAINLAPGISSTPKEQAHAAHVSAANPVAKPPASKSPQKPLPTPPPRPAPKPKKETPSAAPAGACAGAGASAAPVDAKAQKLKPVLVTAAAASNPTAGPAGYPLPPQQPAAQSPKEKAVPAPLSLAEIDRLKSCIPAVAGKPISSTALVLQTVSTTPVQMVNLFQLDDSQKLLLHALIQQQLLRGANRGIIIKAELPYAVIHRGEKYTLSLSHSIV